MPRSTLQVLALSLALLVAGCSGGEGHGGLSSRPELTPVPTPATEEAIESPLPTSLRISGTLKPDEQSRVTPAIPGNVVEVLVERGATVAAGDPLVRLRATDYQLQAQAASAALAQARARLGVGQSGRLPEPGEVPEVRAAEANLRLAEDSLRRAEELARQGAMSSAQLDQARAQAAAARAQHTSALNGVQAAVGAVSAARASSARARTAVDDSVIRAPFAGQIDSVMAHPGEYVAPQMPLVTLMRVDPLRLELRVPQDRIAEVRQGQLVHIRVDAFEDETFEGSVRYISAAVDAQSRGLIVEAVIPNEDGRLRPGLFADARLYLGEQRRAVTIPVRAVLRLAGVSRAFVVREGRIEERILTVLQIEDGRVYVGEGVEAGERVAIERVDQLADGQPLTGAAGPAGSAGAAADASEDE